MVKSALIGNSLNLSEENGYYIQSVSGLGYSTKYNVSDILQKHGVKISNALLKNKAFSLAFMVKGDDFEDLENKRSAVFKALTVNPYEENDKINFQFTLLNNQVVQIDGVVKDVTPDVSKDQLLFNPMNFIIETEYPFLTSVQQYQATIPITTGGGGAIPSAIPFSFGSGVGGYTEITNGGNVFAFPVFRLYGKLTTPVLSDVINNRDLTLNMTIDNGDYIEIDTYNQTVIDQDGVNQLDKLDGDFLLMFPDVNRLKLLTDDVSDVGYVVVTWNYHYVSI